MVYRRCGASGLQLPAVSLGLWHNFGGDTPHETKRAICRTAFDLGITHFDLANNYGPPAGLGRDRLRRDPRAPTSAAYRDELIISTKAGYRMWPGPYGEWGSRKYLLSSLDQSLKRLGLDYVDIFYSHRFDPDTPLEETMGALDTAVRAGKALYVGISSYNSEKTRAGRGDPERPRHPLPDPPAELQHDQPLGRARRPEGHAEGPRHRLDRLHPARPGHADRQVPQGHPRRQPRHPGQVAATRPSSTTRASPTSARSTTSPSAAARPSPRWRSPGSCATAASPPP